MCCSCDSAALLLGKGEIGPFLAARARRGDVSGGSLEENEKSLRHGRIRHGETAQRWRSRRAALRTPSPAAVSSRFAVVFLIAET